MKMSAMIIQHATAAVKTMTYRPKHSHHIDWDATMHERGRLAFAVLTGLMLGAAMFCAMTM